MICSNKVWLLAAAFTLSTLTATGVLAGENDNPISMSLEREDKSFPITKGEVIGAVKKKYKGRILTIKEYPDGGVDCHVVKLITKKGDLRTINISCENL